MKSLDGQKLRQVAQTWLYIAFGIIISGSFDPGTRWAVGGISAILALLALGFSYTLDRWKLNK